MSVFEVQDLRKVSRSTLTDQQISSRIHLLGDRAVELAEELEEIKAMQAGLKHEQQVRKINKTNAGLSNA